MKKRIVSYALIAGVFFGLAGQASAHAHLKTALPADNSAVLTPAELSLTFSEGLSIKFSGAEIVGADKNAIKLGEPVLSDGDKTLKLALPSALAPGTYEVKWHVLSQDGHKTSGSYHFTVKP